jgi:TDG/mug DNA glycosylase family protein
VAAAPAPPLPPPAGQPAQGGGGLALEKMGDLPLRLIIVGHNPSDHAWSSGHFYRCPGSASGRWAGGDSWGRPGLAANKDSFEPASLAHCLPAAAAAAAATPARPPCSNPTNWMWRILRETGIAPAAAIRGAADDGRMPEAAGVGFTDVGSGTPGTDSAQFTPHHFASWRPGFFGRLEAQARRASGSIGCTCGRCGAPSLVAFSGKRQFAELFKAAGKKRQVGKGASVAAAAAAAAGGGGGGLTPDVPAAANPLQQRQLHASSSGTGAADQQLHTMQAHRPSRIDTGRQWVLPEGWPLPLSTEVRLPVGGKPQATRACLCLRSCVPLLHLCVCPQRAPQLLNQPVLLHPQVWVMSSTSGAAPMTREQRYAPWQALAERLQREPWPHCRTARCSGSSNGNGSGEGSGVGHC